MDIASATTLGRRVAMGLGLGWLGLKTSSFVFRSSTSKSKNEQIASYQLLMDLRSGTSLIDPARFKDVKYWDILSKYPAAAVSLSMSDGPRDICERLSAYRYLCPNAFKRLVLGAATLTLLQMELSRGWRAWSLSIPRRVHAATFEMLMATRKLRQSIARDSADYLVDFDEIAADVSQLHNNSILNTLLESRLRSEDCTASALYNNRKKKTHI
jgi:hypothetical protein